MKVLRKVNLIVAIVILSAALYHFFIDSIDFSMIFPLLALMFLLFGMEQIKEKDGDKKLGYAYLIVALVGFTGMILELVKLGI